MHVWDCGIILMGKVETKNKSVLNESISNIIGCNDIFNVFNVYGGCISEAFCYETDKGAFFVKIGKHADMFAAEFKGLEVIDKQKVIRVPKPVGYGSVIGESFIVMEYLPINTCVMYSHKLLGMQLARLHCCTSDKGFGFYCDNFIGSTLQRNTWAVDWVEFFIEYRLKPQINLIVQQFCDCDIKSYGQKLIDIMPRYFEGIKIVPSLIHGDLWSGNIAGLEDCSPVIFDPAPFYGNHEAELSIMEMFGSFSSDFYDAYHKIIPKEAGFDARHMIYQLYHYLNHYNIFGSSYRSSCLSIFQKLLN